MPKDICRPSEIAKWFINRPDRDAGDVMTHLKLQKLIYFAQAWHLANWNKALFQEDMEAWTHGPVTPSIWHTYKGYQWEPLPPDKEPNIERPVVGYLSTIYNRYGKFNAKELERITHEHDPWRVTRGDLPLEAKCTDPIRKHLMRDFYANRIGKQWGS